MQALVTKNKIQTVTNSVPDSNIAFSASYKANPQLNYLKNQHTIDFSKVLKVRTKENLSEEKENPENTTTLILKPQAMAVAGLEGTAIATPLARALVEKGTNVDIYFEPQAIAIAGPGGIAHAQSELEIGYLEYEENKITYLPFYGGAKGQTLQIVQSANGTMLTQIIKTSEIPQEQPQPQPQQQITKVSNEEFSSRELDFTEEIKSIHRTAQNIIQLQAAAKINGQLTDKEQEEYNEQMEQLNAATRNLAHFQQMQTDDVTDDNDDDDEVSRANLRFWFEQKKNKFLTKPNEGNKEEETTTQGGNEENGDDNDGVAINLPPADASVAEAKPVGLAVAGIGGVAASKPVATAVVGPAGLAIARPIATAIAGVNPDDALIPVYVDGYIKFPERKKDKIPSKENCDKVDKTDKEIKKKEEKPKEEKPKEEKSKDDYLYYGIRNLDY